MRIKSTCLVCRGLGKKLDAPCLGCNGYGFIFVNYLPVQAPVLEKTEAVSGLTQRIYNAIAEYQEKYFTTLDIMDIRPMRLKDIAELLGGCNISLISIRTKGMKIQNISVSSLFSKQVSGVSNKVVMKMLKNMLHLNLSDSQYQKLLAEKGITISRRTVSKYRAQI